MRFRYRVVMRSLFSGIVVCAFLLIGMSPVTLADNSSPLVAWNPDGTLLAITLDTEVRILDGNTLAVVNTIPASVTGLAGDTRVKAAWSPSGDRIAIFDNWNIEIWSELGSLDQASLDITVFIEDIPWAIGWSPDQTKLAIALNQVVLVADIDTGNILYTFNDGWSTVYQVLWVNNNRIMLSSTRRLTAIISATTGVIETSFFTEYFYIMANTAIALSPDGTKLAIGDTEGIIEVRDITQASGTMIEFMLGRDQRVSLPSFYDIVGDDSFSVSAAILNLDWSWDGRYLASSSRDGKVRIWDPNDLESVAIIDVAPGLWTGSVEWRPGTLELAVGNLDGSVSVFVPPNVNPLPTEEPTTVASPTTAPTTQVPSTAVPSPTSIPSITPTHLPGEGWLAFVSNRPVTVDGPNVWNIYAGQDGGYLARLTDNNSADVVFTQPVWSPDFSTVAYSKKTGAQPEDLCLLTVATLAENCAFAINGQTPDVPILQPAWSPDGQWLAFVSTTGAVEDIFRQWWLQAQRADVNFWANIFLDTLFIRDIAALVSAEYLDPSYIGPNCPELDLDTTDFGLESPLASLTCTPTDFDSGEVQ